MEVWFGIDSGQLGVSVEIKDGVAIVFFSAAKQIFGRDAVVFEKIILSPEAITLALVETVAVS